MDAVALRKWLAEPRLDLIAAVADGVRDHVATLRSRQIEFYGYALLPGAPYDSPSLGPVVNTEADIMVPRTDDRYWRYRYRVGDWAHWDRGGFAAANARLVEADERFKSLHLKADDNYTRDEFEIAHIDVILESVVRGLQAAKEGGAFGDTDPFLMVWIPDSGHRIMVESVRLLNSPAVVSEFIRVFG